MPDCRPRLIITADPEPRITIYRGAEVLAVFEGRDQDWWLRKAQQMIEAALTLAGDANPR